MAPAAGDPVADVGRRRSTGAAAKLKLHAVLTLVQCSFAGSGIIIKMAVTGGINPIVFAVYRDVLCVCFLVPTAFYSERGRRGRLDWTTIALTVLVGSMLCALVISRVRTRSYEIYASQLLLIFGISLAPALYVSLIGVTVPTFVFIISAASGLEMIQWTRRGGQAKLLGVLSAVCGGALIPFYKGPVIIGSLQGVHLIPLSYLPVDHVHGVLAATFSTLQIEDWQLGVFSLMLTGFLHAAYWTLQAHVIKRFPAPISTCALAHIVTTTMLTTTGFLTIRNRSEWVLPQLSDVFSILYVGLIASGMNFALQNWALTDSGPVLLQSYAPLQSFVTVVMAYLFLGESIHLGSVLGLLCIIIGLYAITWGQAISQKEDKHPVKPVPSTTFEGVFISKGDSDLEQQLLE